MWLAHVEYHLRGVPGFPLVQPWLEALADSQWQRSRRPPPPRSVKVGVIRGYASDVRRAFVETGTFYGDTLAAVRPDFERLYSIELSARLAKRARRRFAGDPGITVLEGDSGLLLEGLLRSISAPVVLWLDGHYSSWLTARGETDTPILRELQAVLAAGTPDDVLLIDDARLFGRQPAYPPLQELLTLLQGGRPGWQVRVEDDIIQARRRQPARSAPAGGERVHSR
jgi:hypothetical protein